jgi:protein subunit release factor B
MKTITHLNESELEEIFSRSSGPGGQNVNKVSTRVTLRHVPTGITVSVSESRSQFMNRQLARERLLTALQQREKQATAAARDAREKLRRQNAKRPRALKQRILETKARQSAKKRMRRRDFGD